MAYDNTNRGSVWGNDNKRDGKQDADYTGSLDIDGIQYWVSMWGRKEGASARAPEFSFTVRRKDKQASPSKPQTAKVFPPDRITTGKQNIIPDDMDDDIPFGR